MAYNFNEFKKGTDSIIDWLSKEYAGIRAGQAAPSIFDSVSVSAYGSKTPINQLATINVEGPKSMRITLWDKSLSGAIDTAIRESNLGLSVSVDDLGLRVILPELSSERRSQLQKLVREKLEEARIRLRSEREKVQKDFDRSELSEDEGFRLKNELQKLVDEVNKKLEDIAKRKEQEIAK